MKTLHFIFAGLFPYFAQAGASPTRSELQNFLNEHTNDVSLCQKNSGSGRNGKIVLEWVIGPDGHVNKINTKENTTHSSELADCIAKKVKSWKFPVAANAKPYTIVWPWVFKSSSSANLPDN